MTVGQYSGVSERQRGFLGAFLLMLALVVGQFVTLERKISFRSTADPAVARTAAEKVSRGSTPRPLSAGGGSTSSDNWHVAASGAERRAAKAKAPGGSDPWPELGLPPSGRWMPAGEVTDISRRPALDDVVYAAAPTHGFDGRGPPQGVL